MMHAHLHSPPLIAFWACHLDFREEALHLVDDQDPNIEELGEDGNDDASTIATETASRKVDQTIPTSSVKSPVDGSGLRRRKNATPTSGSNHINRFSSAKKTPSSTGRFPSNRSPYRKPRTSERVFSQRKSLFDRALDRFSPPGFSQRNLSANTNNEGTDDSLATPSSNNKRSSTPSPSPYGQRRRWGNAYDVNKRSTPHLTSPPVVSLTKGGSARKRRQGSSNIFHWKVHGSGTRGDNSSARKKRLRDDEDVEAAKDSDDMFFASPGVPRGIGKSV